MTTKEREAFNQAHDLPLAEDAKFKAHFEELQAAVERTYDEGDDPTYFHLNIWGMGPAILPLIFARLQNDDEYWFWALMAITGEDPAAQTESFEQAKQVWLTWARVHGYVSLF